ncbi:MAG: ABC transporter ATP-binding protein [Lachnospiraceae bacterium]|nr:ABC transporter ATP-binding protein [Lachnospiraceae bacterium]
MKSKKLKKTKTTAKYGMLSNSLFMIKAALEIRPRVLVLTLLQALFVVAGSLLELYVTPAILGSLERHDALGELLGIISFFALGIMAVYALSGYLEKNQMFARTPVRMLINCKIWKKTGSCSYPVRESQDFIRSYAKSMDAGYRHRQEEADIKNRFFYFRGKTRDRLLAKDVRIFGMGEWLGELMDKCIRMLQDFYLRRERIYLMADFTDIVLSFLRNGAAYAWLIYLTLQGNLSASEFLLYFTAVSGFTTWIGGIMQSFSTLHKQSIEISGIRELADYEEPFLFEGGKALTADKEASYTIELRDVTFRYPGSEREIFSHLNLILHPGEKLAVVGANGAGKTTLIKLLCGFYDPDEGEVLLNGVNIKEYDRRDYYRLFAAVFQDFSLLAGEVAENVASFDQKMNMDRVRDCIGKVGLGKKMEELPAGYHTHLVKEVYEDAVEFSGGELQRLMMARLLYKDSPVMILDEPTAALDAIAESDIYQKYQELARGKSSVFISHRLASTRFCDRIILLEDGKIAEEGTHEELLARKKTYAELFEIQSKYYADGLAGKGAQEHEGK